MIFIKAWDGSERPKGVQFGFQDAYEDGVSTEILIDGKAYWMCTPYEKRTTVIFPMFQLGRWVFYLFPNYWGGVELGQHDRWPMKGHMDILARIEKEGEFWKKEL